MMDSAVTHDSTYPNTGTTLAYYMRARGSVITIQFAKGRDMPAMRVSLQVAPVQSTSAAQTPKTAA